MVVSELPTLKLVDGLTIRQGEEDKTYTHVELRETTVADEIKAAKLSEQVGELNGRVVFAPNMDVFTHAMTMLSIVQFTGDGLEPLPAHAINMDTFGKLSRGDVTLIEERSMLIELQAQVRFGLITQDDFDAALANSVGGEVTPQTKQPDGQSDGVGQADTVHGSQPVCEHVVDRTSEPAQSPVDGTEQNNERAG